MADEQQTQTGQPLEPTDSQDKACTRDGEGATPIVLTPPPPPSQ